MNDKLEQALVQLVDKTLAGVDTSIEFLSQEIPDVIGQLLMWHAVSNMVYCILGFVWLWVCCLPVRKPKKGVGNWCWEWDEYREKHSLTAESAVGLVLILPLGFAIDSILRGMTALQIWIAPKVWLLEYAASLTK